ncbi:MAG: hypothetical protein P1U87_14160 [Verrucomicrobiales bacterium]|nr:hypothetical protein [Verrucomicrobiales bacterium]
MTVFDELSVSFENPATDAMGYDAVQGKLYCGVDGIQLQFKEKDRAFRKNEPVTIEFDYGEVEKTEYISKWFRPKVLVFQTRSPDRLAAFPGAKVGRVELQVLPESKAEAKKVAGLIDFKQSEAFLEETEARIDRSKIENE